MFEYVKGPQDFFLHLEGSVLSLIRECDKIRIIAGRELRRCERIILNGSVQAMGYKFTKNELTGEVRLNKYLSDAGLCSRREADRLIEAGKVTVDGLPAVKGQRISKGQRVAVDGEAAERERELILLAVNKPRGVVCTTDRRWGDRTIYDVVGCPKRVFTLGRLDKESEGLLLMTNDGDILNKIMRAGNYHEKEYLVTVDKEITPEFLDRMAGGLYLRELDATTRPCRIEQDGRYRFRIILTQGLNRQIRRMCETLHYKVRRLVRVRIMNIELGNLQPGEYREVTAQEFAQLRGRLRRSQNPGQRNVTGQRGQSEYAEPGKEKAARQKQTRTKSMQKQIKTE